MERAWRGLCHVLYTAPPSERQLLVVAGLPLGDTLTINATVTVPDSLDPPVCLELVLADYVNTAAELRDYGALFCDADALQARLRSDLVAKLFNRPAAPAATSAKESSVCADAADMRRPCGDPLVPNPLRPVQPDPLCDDPLRDDPLRVPGRGRQVYPPPGFAVGGDDLVPGGLGYDPMGGGGLVGPGHPGFGDPGGGFGIPPGGGFPDGGAQGPWGAPPPPGARFDPYIGAPDNDMFMPPGPDGFGGPPGRHGPGRFGDDMFG